MSKIIKQRERGSLIVVSGPSGCGKGTVIQEFLKGHKDAWLSISCTSRDPRPGDVPNETYYFITRDEFETFCFKPAYEKRKIVRTQLSIADMEYNPKMPDIRVREF